MQDLTIAIMQTEIYWEDPERNIDMYREKCASITNPIDLLVLPEMCSTGFSMEPGPQAETMNGKTIQWMKEYAKSQSCAVTGSIMTRKGNSVFNRMIWAASDGTIQSYDKRHLFTFAGEDKHYTAGQTHLTVNLHGWNMALFVCYDLRFPVWCRNTTGYDCALFVANWPEKRRHAWNTLLPARAIENQSYVIGVNRIGTDGYDQTYSGDSAVYDMEGIKISQTKPHEERIEIITLSRSALDTFRKDFTFLNDRDAFTLDKTND